MTKYKVHGYLEPVEEIKPKTNNSEIVTFNTNLKMNNHTRNYLQSMALLGFADSQKTALDIAISAYLDSLTKEEKESIELQYRNCNYFFEQINKSNFLF